MNARRWVKMIVIMAMAAGSVIWAAEARAKTITAASCSQEDVQAAISDPGTVSGDTVIVPAGECTWDTAVFIPSGKKITLQGAGMDQTVITRNPIGAMAINLYLSGSRVTGFGFIGGQVLADGDGWRVDHCRFYKEGDITDKSYEGVLANGQRENQHPTGLVDHCIFYNSRVVVGGWAGLLAHALWNQPLNLGSGDGVVYIEDCVFTLIASGNTMDSNYGGNYVFRYNTVNNASIDCHSVQAPNRASRKWEIYNNTINQVDKDMWVPFLLRAGTGVVFNNTITGIWTAPNIPLDNVRSRITGNSPVEWIIPQGLCDGDSAWDGNRRDDFGFHSSGNDEITLVSAGKNWATDQWVGYMIKNLTDGTRGFISANDGTSITAGCCEKDWDTGDEFEIVDKNSGSVLLSGAHEGPNDSMGLIVYSVPAGWEGFDLPNIAIRNLTDKSNMADLPGFSPQDAFTMGVNSNSNGSYTWIRGTFDETCTCEFDWDNGDEFEITSGYPCRDQIGRSTDEWLWTTATPYPPQALEPAYEWNNRRGTNDVDFFTRDISQETLVHIQEGRDYYNDVPEGLSADIPSSCEPYEAYWATDENTLYKCTATDTWEAYYTPYTYPHPLTLSGGGLAEDVTDDGEVNALDIQACVNHVLMVQDWGSAADVNNSGSVDAVDIQAIVNEVLRI